MKITSIKFKNKTCFSKEFAGFEQIKPINVIIGKNNSGKSHLLEAIEYGCNLCFGGMPLNNNINVSNKYGFKEMLVEAQLDEFDFELGNKASFDLSDDLQMKVYFESLMFDAWKFGEDDALLLGSRIVAKFFNKGGEWVGDLAPVTRNVKWIETFRSLMCMNFPFTRKRIYKVKAERDIKPESNAGSVVIESSGVGITGILEKYLHDKSGYFNDANVLDEFVSAYNEIVGPENEALYMSAKADTSSYQRTYELFLRSGGRGFIPLSDSGSGLKTVLIVLTSLFILPHYGDETNSRRRRLSPSRCVFAFEELENNLHPSVLRRLLIYMEKYIVNHQSMLFLTTHSNVVLDFFHQSGDASITRVTHNGEYAVTEDVSDYFSCLDVLDDLGVKASDLLQANGIVWVEGPSDRIYINKWIELIAEKLETELPKEGRDYQFAYYGGSLLSHASFDNPEGSEEDRVSDDDVLKLLKVNPNVIVVCDSDKDSEDAELKKRVTLVKNQLEKGTEDPEPFYRWCWVLAVREIENYLPLTALRSVHTNTKKELREVKPFEAFAPREGASYVKTVIGLSTFNKTVKAKQYIQHMTVENMKSRHDWSKGMEQMLQVIHNWNSDTRHSIQSEKSV